MRVKITTRLTGRTSDRYLVTVAVDGVVKDIFPAMVWEVTRVRNRQCAKWSNIADEVTAGEIPPVFTLDYQRSWRNKFDAR